MRRSIRLVATAAFACCIAPWAASGADGDADGVGDLADVCSEIANPDQRDSDLDGFGNACDLDFDDDGVVGNADYDAIRSALGAHLGDSKYSAELDVDGDGLIGDRELEQLLRRYGQPPGPSGLACAGVAPCFAGYVAIERAEEVLSRSVRLRWMAAVSPPLFRVERRTAGSGWGLVALVSGPAREFVDVGPGGRGLDPGTYEYRVRGGGPWSETLAFSVVEECAGQPAMDPSLPVVEIADHEPDGDYDGDDVRAALDTCSGQRGCVLRALPVVYDDVNVELAGETGYDFSQGLVIEGHGSATVFRSRVFSEQDHDPSLCPEGSPGLCYQPSSVFSLIKLGRVPQGVVRFRNFEIQGRKREQPDPGTSPITWQHWGIIARSPVLDTTHDGCVHNLTLRELMSGGVGLLHAEGWIIERSRAFDIGCHDEFTPCDALRTTPEYANVPGLRSDGTGFAAATHTSGTIIRNNRSVRAVKYGISTSFGARDFLITRNLVRSSLGAGIECNSCNSGVIELNQVRSMRIPTGRNETWPNGFFGEAAQGIQCGGPVEDLTVRDNVVSAGDGAGVRIVCSGPRILVQGNVIDGNCRVRGQSLVVQASSDVSLLDNVVRDGTGGCNYSVAILSTLGARIEGGSIESGPSALAGFLAFGTSLRPTSGLVLRDVRLEAHGAHAEGVRLEPTVSGATIYDSFCVTGFPEPWVDRSAGGALHLADPGKACVP